MNDKPQVYLNPRLAKFGNDFSLEEDTLIQKVLDALPQTMTRLRVTKNERNQQIEFHAEYMRVREFTCSTVDLERRQTAEHVAQLLN